MSRPRPSFGTVILLGAFMALAASACGKGLYTQAGHVHQPGGSGGGVIDPGSGSGSGSGSSSPDAWVQADSSPPLSPDVPPKFDAYPGSTREANYEATTVIQYGEATLTIPKGSFPQGGAYPVTLSLVSSDEMLPGYGGPIGGIYSISTEATLWSSAILKIHVTPDASISPQRVGMAYVDEEAKAWILIVNPDTTYDSNTGDVTGTVTYFHGKRYFAPVEICARDGQDGGVCHPNLSCKTQPCPELSCKAQACQE
jgi:hypothetical protein